MRPQEAIGGIARDSGFRRVEQEDSVIGQGFRSAEGYEGGLAEPGQKWPNGFKTEFGTELDKDQLKALVR